jgi:hypothetical protein
LAATPDSTAPANAIAHANPTLTLHLCWQNVFRESIVETGQTLRLAPCVEKAAAKQGWKVRWLRPETSEF